MVSVTKLGTAALLAAVAAAGFGGSAQAAGAKIKSFAYNLAPGACTGAETVPSSSVPVQVMGSQLTVGYRGVGQASLIAVPSNFLEWVASDVYTTSVSSGYSGSAGTHIVYLDFSGLTDLQVASPTQVKVCVSASSPYTGTGTVTFVY